MSFIRRISLIVSVLLSLQLFVLPECGWCMTTTETTQNIVIPINQWQNLKDEFQALNQELLQCKNDLTTLKKPSTELLSELQEAQAMLLKLQKELDEQKNDLNLLSNEVSELKALSAKLKTQIDKERRIHKRQVWQNRIWCLLIGAGIGVAASR